MSDQAPGTPLYTMGYGEEFIRALMRYQAPTHAAHLLPHLRSGLRLLDFGCGPGTISIGLAKAIEPGELHGIDMEESQIELARAFAAHGGHENATFHVGDVTDLPFEDGYFDVAHCHNLLMHVPDTATVLSEVKRVLKPGGIVSGREMIGGSSFTHPDYGVLRRAWDMFEDLLEADDGHPQMGKDMKLHFHRAGFTDIQATATFDNYSSPEDVAFIYGIALKWFLAPEITEAAIQYGASTEEICERIGLNYAKWKDDPGAFCGVAHGEIIARKP